jgi:hypothetical protein
MPATRTAAGAAPRLYFCERGGLPVEVACVADAVRLAGYWSDHGGRERAGRDGTTFWPAPARRRSTSRC